VQEIGELMRISKRSIRIEQDCYDVRDSFAEAGNGIGKFDADFYCSIAVRELPLLVRVAVF